MSRHVALPFAGRWARYRIVFDSKSGQTSNWDTSFEVLSQFIRHFY